MSAGSGGTATVYFRPDQDSNGTSQFNFAAIDNNGLADPSPALATIDVTAVNDAPSAANDSATVTEDSVNNVIAVLGNDSAGPNESNQALTVTAASALHGSVTINPDGTLKYTPTANYNGADTISYTVTDNGTTNGAPDPKSANATVAVTVTEINDAPVASNDTASVAQDSVGNLITVLGNDSAGPANESGQTLTVTAAGAQHGTVVINPNGTLTYTPNADYSGPDSISYTITDNGTTNGVADPKSANATVAVTVVPAADLPPIANSDGYGLLEDGTLTTTAATGVLANDTDSDTAHANLTAILVSGPANAESFVLHADGSFSYMPSANYNGPDSFTYKINDGFIDGNVATVNLTVDPVNDAPVYFGGSAGTNFVVNGAPVPVATNVFVNDIDNANFNGGSLTATVTAGGHSGDTLLVAGDQFITLSGTTVMFDADGTGNAFSPIAIGSVTDNLNSLSIDLNSNAGSAAMIALTQAIQFQNTIGDPSADTRVVTFTLNDGGGTADGGQDTAFFDADRRRLASYDRCLAGRNGRAGQLEHRHQLESGRTSVDRFYARCPHERRRCSGILRREQCRADWCAYDRCRQLTAYWRKRFERFRIARYGRRSKRRTLEVDAGGILSISGSYSGAGTLSLAGGFLQLNSAFGAAEAIHFGSGADDILFVARSRVGLRRERWPPSSTRPVARSYSRMRISAPFGE